MSSAVRPTEPDVFLVRHGATEWSESGRHTGKTDLPLLPSGRGEAERLRGLLKGQEFALVLISPLQRARETCRIVGLENQAELTDDLREWDYGAYEGMTTEQIRQTEQDWTVWTGECPEGETIAEVTARADRVIARARCASGNVALFAHGHILRVVTARWCELDAVEGRRFQLATATLSVLGHERGVHGVRLWNTRG